MTDTVRVPRELLAEVEGLLWLEGYEVSAQRLNDLLAASPQGEGQWITHDGGPNPVPCPFCAGAGCVPGDQGHEKCGECDGTGNTEGVKP